MSRLPPGTTHADIDAAFGPPADAPGDDAEPVVECEECDTTLPEADATAERVPGYDGPVTLFFCPGCSDA